MNKLNNMFYEMVSKIRPFEVVRNNVLDLIKTYEFDELDSYMIKNIDKEEVFHLVMLLVAISKDSEQEDFIINRYYGDVELLS